MNNQKRSGEHERQVQELRRSNAAGAHGGGKYNRKSKYRIDWIEEAEEDFPEEE